MTFRSIRKLKPTTPPAVADDARAAKNFGLSEARFVRLAEELREGNPLLFETIFIAQVDFCKNTLQKTDGYTPEEAHEASMDALLYLRKLIINNKITYGNLRHLYIRIARQRYARKRGKHLRTVDMTPETHDRPEDVPFEATEYEQLKAALSRLGEGCQRLLKSYYFLNNSCAAIAELTGNKAAAIRKQKSRCVTRLRAYFVQLSN
ncbi:hypothetical protein LEM8419_00783 [Neolewinella maritima]|uniref:Sigma-70 family RNA polymerase sigma factor n=1 Tax=Neolewinella maritima TaxID=1383882 RepID=A0ABM9AYW0_9BACT|nr:hypothetical protein [Neolewinella maritima]CAH0999483.1 hypothetical protein LEM8419_00783 [Neolewinella maritima]